MRRRPPYEIELAWSVGDGASPDCDEKLLRAAVESALRRHGCRSARVEVALVDDAAIARLAERYLGHEGPTDVLSFDLGESDRAAPPPSSRREPAPSTRGTTPHAPGRVDGQLIVSVDTARRQAAGRGHSLGAELALYCIHGTLHLLGCDDATPAEAERMHRMEDELLTELGLGVVYGHDSPSGSTSDPDSPAKRRSFGKNR